MFPNEPVLYIIGDSVWCPDAEKALIAYQPDFAIIFAGEAKFIEGDPITMGLYDIERVAEAVPNIYLHVSHMESWNHCVLTRESVREFIRRNNFEDKMVVPKNGEFIEFKVNSRR